MIEIHLETFQQRREGGNVTGAIFLELPNGAFPSQEWSDFPVIVLGWWIEALLQLESSASREVEWLFMEGPQRATLIKVASAASVDVFEFSEVRRALLETAERVVVYCEQHGFLSKDLEILRANLGRLKANQPKLPNAVLNSTFVEIRLSDAATAHR